MNHLPNSGPLLSKIDSPADLKTLSVSDLERLAVELREYIVGVVSFTGGHLGSTLGVIELTIALHYVYDTPEDLIVWDVGAQAYAHKILTGRREAFITNRQYGGISGFPRREESPYDTFGVGHSSTSISAALGMAIARDLKGENHKVIAVIGDGGMTGGMAFEALNNAGASGTDLTVILNDNRMSISPNVGALSRYLSALRSDPRFEQLKDSLWEFAGHLPKGSKLRRALSGVGSGLRAMFVPGLWFERLGFRYVGPIDGHNLSELVKMLRWLKGVRGPVVLHVLTEKGKGYPLAENDGLRLHSVSKFDPQTGPVVQNTPHTFSAIFADELLKQAECDPHIVAITPAMIEGSCLGEFQKRFPQRCFDVGIAEQHSVTFAAGLATRGLKPVVAIYSTFLQRAYDQLIHDVALQNLPVILGVDRAGLVGEDGPTHHGAFDISYLRAIPNLVILSPRDEEQTRLMLRWALNYSAGPIAIRFPRGVPPKFPPSIYPQSIPLYPEILREGEDGLVIGCGTILYPLLRVAEQIEREYKFTLQVVDIRCIKPLDGEFLTQMGQKFSRWATVEENALAGGMGSAVMEWVSESQMPITVKRFGLPDRFVTHGDRNNLLKDVGLDEESLFRNLSAYFLRKTSKNRRLKVLGL
ncbi:MAG: 1-deoxy-D-xylulose-5-phosphate synthase [bacterium]